MWLVAAVLGSADIEHTHHPRRSFDSTVLEHVIDISHMIYVCICEYILIDKSTTSLLKGCLKNARLFQLTAVLSAGQAGLFGKLFLFAD